MPAMTWMLRLAVLVAFLLQAACATGQYYGPISDHFNGLTFYYPKQFCPPITFHKPVKTRDAVPIKVTFINHATFLIETPYGNILTDPIYSCRPSPSQCMGYRRLHPPGVAFNRLPHIDVVIISHNHYDHMDMLTLVRLEKKFHPVFIAGLGNKAFLEANGLTHVMDMDWWQSFRYHQIIIDGLPTRHWSSRWFIDANGTLALSYGLTIGDKSIYFAGDSGYGPHFCRIAEHWGSPDLALLPIGANQPHYYIKDVHMNPCEAVHASLDLCAKRSIGMHFGTFPSTIEGKETNLRDLYYARQALGISNKVFFTIPIGSSYDL